jgi:hypothetical protein
VSEPKNRRLKLVEGNANIEPISSADRKKNGAPHLVLVRSSENTLTDTNDDAWKSWVTSTSESEDAPSEFVSSALTLPTRARKAIMRWLRSCY